MSARRQPPDQNGLLENGRSPTTRREVGAEIPLMPDDRTAPSTAESLFPPAREPSASAGHLPTPLFEIAVAAMWSGGELATRSVERGHALARKLHPVPRRGGSPFGAMAAGPLPFGELEFDGLDVEERRLAYAITLWVGCRGDQPPSARRASFCRGLQLRLRISDRDASMLRDIVTAVEATAEADDADASLGLLLAALAPALG